MGNPMPKHKQVESVVGTASDRAHRYQTMGRWKQQKLIRIVEPPRVYPVGMRHKYLVVEVGPEINFTVRDTSDYPNEVLIAQIMLALNSMSTPCIWEEGAGGYAGNWRPRGQMIRTDTTMHYGSDQYAHRAVADNGRYVTWLDETSDITASMMAKQIDEDVLRKLLYGDGKASPPTNATLPPPVKRKP